MSRVLILYASKEGHTARIAHRLAGHLAQAGHQAEAAALTEVADDAPLDGYDAFVVGGSVHMGRHDKDLAAFVQDHLETLSRSPSAFFSVSMAQANPAEPNQAEAERYVDDFLEATGWAPDHVARFAGALTYTQYNWILRTVMKRIAATTGQSTDTTRDHVYTDWDQVAAFGEVIQHLATGQQRAAAKAPPAPGQAPPEEGDALAGRGPGSEGHARA